MNHIKKNILTFYLRKTLLKYELARIWYLWPNPRMSERYQCTDRLIGSTGQSSAERSPLTKSGNQSQLAAFHVVSHTSHGFSHAVSGPRWGEVISRHRWKRKNHWTRWDMRGFGYTYRKTRQRNSGKVGLQWKVKMSLLMWCMYRQHFDG